MKHSIRTINKVTFKYLLNFKCTIDSRAMVSNHHLGLWFGKSNTSNTRLDRWWGWIGWIRVHGEFKIKYGKGGNKKRQKNMSEACDWKRGQQLNTSYGTKYFGINSLTGLYYRIKEVKVNKKEIVNVKDLW